MVLPGIVRRLNKNIPNLLQVLLFICVLHYVGQGMFLTIQKKLHLGRYGRFNPEASPQKKKMDIKKLNKLGRASTSSTSTTTTSTVPPPPFEEAQRIIDERINILHEGCKRWNLGDYKTKESTLPEEDERYKTMINLPKNPAYTALLTSENKKIAYCPVTRAGHNWMAKRLLQLKGTHSEQELKHLKQPAGVVARGQYPFLYSVDRYPLVLPVFNTFLIVRHPFDRLLASYRSILENAKTDPHNYLKYGRRIVRTYRKVPGGGKEPTFSEFISFVSERDIRYLDEAWQPMTRRCTPCKIPYNGILHYENLWNDTYWLWEKASFGKLNTTDFVTNSITPEIRRQYFSEITILQMVKLNQRYKIDFDLFGYTIEEHLTYAQPGDAILTSDMIKTLSIPKNKQSNKLESEFVGFNEENNEVLNEIEDESVNEKLLEKSVKKAFLMEDDSISNHPEAVAPFVPN